MNRFWILDFRICVSAFSFIAFAFTAAVPAQRSTASRKNKTLIESNFDFIKVLQ